jgi:hypothetical protein
MVAGGSFDPDLAGQGFRLRAAAAEPFRVRRVGGPEGGGPAGLDVHPAAVVHGGGGVHRDAGVPVLGVAVSEERPAGNVRVLDRAELAGKSRAVLQGFKADSEYGLSFDTCGLEWDWAMFSFA